MIALSQSFGLISEVDAGLSITVDLILFNLGEGTSTASDATALIVLNLVSTNERSRIE